MEDINPEFPEQRYFVLVIGANDVTNPAARTNKNSPIYGMPILEVDKAKNVIVVKRSMSTGFAGVENGALYRIQCVHAVQRRQSSHAGARGCQRLYAVLKGTELEEKAEEENPNERKFQPKEIPPVEYDPKMPIEFFDFIVIDECHRSIYNLWKQVLEYYDAFEIGLTATPDKRTIGYFDQNMVSEYSHEMAVVDGVNVGYQVFIIDTKITRRGATLWKGEIY